MYPVPATTMAANLAMRIHDALSAPKDCLLDLPAARFIVAGRLQLRYGGRLEKEKARCRFLVDHRWIEDIPQVICDEPWRAPDSNDWHINDEGLLCIEFNAHWMDVIGRLNRKHGLCPTADYAAAWLMRSSAELLYRHLLRSRGTITEWRPEWDYWPHSKEMALAEYKKIRRAQFRRAPRHAHGRLSQS